MSKINYLINYKSGVIMPFQKRQTPLTTYDEEENITREYPKDFFAKNEIVSYEENDLKTNALLNITLKSLEQSGVILRENSSYTYAETYIFQGKNYQLPIDGYDFKEEVHAFYESIINKDVMEELKKEMQVQEKEYNDVAITTNQNKTK